MAAYLRAQVAAERGEWATAATRYAELVDRKDIAAELRPRARLAQVYSLAYQGDWDDVLQLAASAKKEFKGWPEAYEFDYCRGRALFAEAELNEAREAFKLVTTAPASKGTEVGFLAHMMIAETYYLQHNNESALASFESTRAAATSQEWQIKCHLQCGKLREELGRYDEAARDYERITREFPDSPEAAEAERCRAACNAQAETIRNLPKK
jgi:tetratricopeptide (TPR) repeat protein